MDDLLLQLQAISLDMLQHVSGCIYPSLLSGLADTPNHLFSIPELDLEVPSHDDLIKPLLKLGAPSDCAEKLSRIHHSYSTQLAEQFLTSYRESCSELVSGSKDCHRDFARLRKANQELYSRRIMAWSKELCEAVHKRYIGLDQVKASRRASFNHVCYYCMSNASVPNN